MQPWLRLACVGERGGSAVARAHRRRYARLFGWLAGHQCRGGRIVLDMPRHLGCLQRPARRQALPDWAPGPRTSRWQGAYLVASGPRQNYPAACPFALVVAELVLGAHPERPLASPWVRLAAPNPALRPVAAQPILSASSRRTLRPGSRSLASSAVHRPQNPLPSTARSALTEAPSAGRARGGPTGPASKAPARRPARTW
jgi:hypothetical protein